MFVENNQTYQTTKPFFYTYSLPSLTGDAFVFDEVFGNLGLYTSSLVQFNSLSDFEESNLKSQNTFFFDISPYIKDFKDSYDFPYFIGEKIFTEPFALIDNRGILSKTDELTEVFILPIQILN